VQYLQVDPSEPFTVFAPSEQASTKLAKLLKREGCDQISQQWLADVSAEPS
jgi:hypothetical protein